MPQSPNFPLGCRSLAAAMTAGCCVSAAPATAWAAVSNCNDSGTGSLRAAVLAAASGDTVDARGLAGVCSTITLSTGAIGVGQANLKIIGPGRNALTVTAGAGATTRVFTHSGSGVLEIDDLAISHGHVGTGSGVVTGGCVDSNGNVSLRHASVLSCTAQTDSGAAAGGGVYALGALYLLDTVIDGNSAAGGASGHSSGGGAATRGGLTAKYSTISNNTASNDSDSHGNSGGIYVLGSGLFLRSTTISGNRAGQYDGGLIAFITGNATLINTTISGNRALRGATGGGYIAANTLNIANTTVAANRAYVGSSSFAAGLVVSGTGTAPTLKLESTLLSDNLFGMTPVDEDFSSAGFAISGYNNLVRTTAASVPADTLLGVCPLLGPLRANGGAVATHALLSRSPAIDAGSNALALAYDQRGAPYARESSPPGAMSPVADIGAYEVQADDIVFNVSFDGCPG